MKRYLTYLTITAAVALFASACVQSDIEEVNVRLDEYPSLTVGFPTADVEIDTRYGAATEEDLQIVDSLNMHCASLAGVSAEGAESAAAEDTRVAFDDPTSTGIPQLKWKTGDKIAILKGTADISNAVEGAAYVSEPMLEKFDGRSEAQFYFTKKNHLDKNGNETSTSEAVPAEGSNITIVYPSSGVISPVLAREEGVEATGSTIFLSDSLVYDPSLKMIPSAMVLCGTGKMGHKVRLQHMCAYMRISLTNSTGSDQKIRAMDITTNDYEPITGEYSLKYNNSTGNLSLSEEVVNISGVTAQNTIEIRKYVCCRERLRIVQNLSNEWTWGKGETTHIIVPIPAGTYSKGFCVQVYTKNLSSGLVENVISKTIKGSSSSASITLRQKVFYPMATVNVTSFSTDPSDPVNGRKVIVTANDLYDFLDDVNKGDFSKWVQPNGEVLVDPYYLNSTAGGSDGHVDLTTLSGGRAALPTVTKEFNGILNFQGFKIVYKNPNTCPSGCLFQQLGPNGVIKNLVIGGTSKHIRSLPATSTSEVAATYSGAVVNVCNGGKLVNIVNNGQSYIGAYTFNSSTNDVTEDTPTEASHTLGAQMRVGALVGRMIGGEMINCTNNNNININLYKIKQFNDATFCTQYFGGLAGNTQDSALVENCFNNGDIRIKVGYHVSHGLHIGGIAGSLNNGSKATKCINRSRISIELHGGAGSFLCVGGITGYSAGAITNCRSDDDSNSSAVEGIYVVADDSTLGAGTDGEPAFRGVLSSTVVGGISGYQAGAVSGCVNNVPVSVEYGYYTGGQNIGGIDVGTSTDIKINNVTYPYLNDGEADSNRCTYYQAHVLVAGITAIGYNGFSMSGCTNNGRIAYLCNHWCNNRVARQHLVDNDKSEPNGGVATDNLKKRYKSTGRPCVAGIVAAPWGNVSNCTNSGNVNVQTKKGTAYSTTHEWCNSTEAVCVGGVVGADFYSADISGNYAVINQSKSNVTNCHNKASIYCYFDDPNADASYQPVGGVVGWPGIESGITSVTSGCSTTDHSVEVGGTGKFRVGGIHGGSGNIDNCQNNGTFIRLRDNVDKRSVAGGIAGFHGASRKLKNSTVECDVAARCVTDNVVESGGGIVGGGIAGLVGNISNGNISSSNFTNNYVNCDVYAESGSNGFPTGGTSKVHAAMLCARFNRDAGGNTHTFGTIRIKGSLMFHGSNEQTSISSTYFSEHKGSVLFGINSGAYSYWNAAADTSANLGANSCVISSIGYWNN